MNMFNRFFRFYIYANIHVSIAVFSMVLITGVFYEINVNKIAVFMGGATFVAYNWIRLLKYKNNNLREEIFVWFENNTMALLVLNVVLSFYLFLLLFSFRLETLITMIPFVILTAFYMFPLRSIRNKYISLRNIAMIKIFIISISWTGLVVLVPLKESSVQLGTVEMLFFLMQFLFVFVLTLPFDIRDVKFDNDELKTIPQVLGIVKSKIVGVFFVIAFWAVSLFVLNSVHLWITLFIALILLMFLLKSTSNQSRYYASFFVESIPILWLLLLLIAI